MTQPFLYSVEREYPVSVDRLWKAWTDPDELESWYFPTDLSSTKGEAEMAQAGMNSYLESLAQYLGE